MTFTTLPHGEYARNKKYGEQGDDKSRQPDGQQDQLLGGCRRIRVCTVTGIPPPEVGADQKKGRCGEKSVVMSDDAVQGQKDRHQDDEQGLQGTGLGREPDEEQLAAVEWFDRQQVEDVQETE